MVQVGLCTGTNDPLKTSTMVEPCVMQRSK